MPPRQPNDTSQNPAWRRFWTLCRRLAVAEAERTADAAMHGAGGDPAAEASDEAEFRVRATAQPVEEGAAAHEGSFLVGGSSFP